VAGRARRRPSPPPRPPSPLRGHDFRPDYKAIGAVRDEALPGLPITALTATAPRAVVDDVLRCLRMPAPARFSAPFFRANLVLRVLPKHGGRDDDGEPRALAALAAYVNDPCRASHTGIVYCLSRDEAEATATYLRESAGVAAAHYHAGVAAGRRSAVQAAWQAGAVRVVVATIAFGMGIDKADVRFVVHATLSKCLAGYFQEAGRAGRDGRPAECVLTYSPRDAHRVRSLLRLGGRGPGGKARYERGVGALARMVAWCESSRACRHAALLSHFGDWLPGGRCGASCDVCRGEAVSVDGGAGGGARPRGGAAARGRGASSKRPRDGGAPPAPAAFVSAAALLRAGGGARGGGPDGARPSAPGRRLTSGATFVRPAGR